ncbi:MAG: hypothetical protein AAF708_14505 [Deinococcota bacterium]
MSELTTASEITSTEPVTKRKKRTFASITQTVLVFVMLASFVMIGQQLEVFFNVGEIEIDLGLLLYQIGLGTLIGSALLQIAFGNIPPGANFRQTMRILGIAVLIIAAVFGVGILIAGPLTRLGSR